MRKRRDGWSRATFFALALCAASLGSAARAEYVTFGNGFGSKWDNRVHGTPALVTWGFVPDGTTVDPGLFIAAEVTGGSNVTQLRATYDASYGAGAFDAALQRAFATWSAVAGIQFVGPVADPGLPMAGPGATAPDIRVGAFAPVAGSNFSFIGAVGFGPPGDDEHFPDPLAGDVMFNLAQSFIQPASAEGQPLGAFGNDLEGLMLHELGHAAMGLGHPASGVAEVMYVGAGCCNLVNHDPSPDDIAGAQVVYGLSATPACGNDIDDDSDGRTDHQVVAALNDFGCTSGADTTETGAAACDDGLDNDGDGRTDYRVAPSLGDIGCSNHRATLESPQCQDGVNNDLALGIDFDEAHRRTAERRSTSPIRSARRPPAAPRRPPPRSAAASGRSSRSRSLCWRRQGGDSGRVVARALARFAARRGRGSATDAALRPVPIVVRHQLEELAGEARAGAGVLVLEEDECLGEITRAQARSPRPRAPRACSLARRSRR